MKKMKTIMGLMRLIGLMRPMRLMGLIGLIGLMGGCSTDVEETPGQQTLELVPISSSFFEVEPIGGTRGAGSLPAGYVPFDNLYATAPLHTNIGVWMTPTNTTTLEDFIYKSGHDWKSTVELPSTGTFYIYGIMPHTGEENASITSRNGSGGADYANGAVITLTDYPTVTGDDICAIVGLRKGTSGETITNLDADVLRGNFAYTVGTPNNIFILLKHLYAGLRFRARIDPEYNKVRDIYVTKVELIGLNMYQKGNLKVTLTANTTGADPSAIVFDTSGESGIVDFTTPALLYEKDGSDPTNKGFHLEVTDPASFLGCFSFGGGCTQFKLRTTYDVYDKKGNCTRRGCTADNVINLMMKFGITDPTTILPGNIYTINLLVNPTYLYVLSEPDLDNPSVELE